MSMMDQLLTHSLFNGAKGITAKTRLNAPTGPIDDVLRSVDYADSEDYYKSINFVSGMTQSVTDRIKTAFSCEISADDQSYSIVSDGDITVYSNSKLGLLYGAYTIKQLAKGGMYPEGIVYNVPVCKFRGLKLYLPEPDNLDIFYDIVDMLCYYRFNILILEIGGAMEYKRHPEINEGWLEYASFMSEKSGRSGEIQGGTYPWKKNSIHSENAGGKALSQETVKRLVEYCLERGLEVIPEIPCLSHSDYLLTRHPELSERANDAHADTYCPSNPASYDLLFDVTDEVIDVFKPKRIHMGHDEYYSICVCEKCRERDAADVLADDINKIYGYLSQKGVGMMIYCDKLINAMGKKGQTWGGARVIYKDRNGNFLCEIPPTHKAIDKIPRDIVMMHWYWGIRNEFDEEFTSRKFETAFANYEIMTVINWNERRKRGIDGGAPSNWSHLRDENLQRNSIYMSITYSAETFWRDDYRDDEYETVLMKCFNSLYEYRNEKILKKPHIKIVHASGKEKTYGYFGDGDFMDLDEDKAGDYVITYADGKIDKFGVIYGINVSGKKRSWTRTVKDDIDSYEADKLLYEVATAALPVRYGDETWYEIALPVSDDLCNVKSVAFVPKEPDDYNIYIRSIEFVA